MILQMVMAETQLYCLLEKRRGDLLSDGQLVELLHEKEMSHVLPLLDVLVAEPVFRLGPTNALVSFTVGVGEQELGVHVLTL